MTLASLKVSCFMWGFSKVQSHIIALLIPEGSHQATLLVRRSNGQFALQGIDSRLAAATRAANWFRKASPIVDANTSAVVGYEVTEPA